MQSTQRVALSEEQKNGDEVVETLTKDNLVSFVSSSPYALVYAHYGANPQAFPLSIKARLGYFHVPPIRLGVIDLSAVEWTAGVKLFVRLHLGNLGSQPNVLGHPPPGYYLFAKGATITFHAGNIEFDNDGTQLGWGAFAGFLGLVLDSPKVARLGVDIATWKAGDRVVDFVEEALRKQAQAEASSASHGSPPVFFTVDEDELRRAYTVLGLTPTSNDDEVKSAHRKLVRRHHPDLQSPDHVAQKRATLRTAELNNARDLILNRRKAGRR